VEDFTDLGPGVIEVTGPPVTRPGSFIVRSVFNGVVGNLSFMIN